MRRSRMPSNPALSGRPGRSAHGGSGLSLLSGTDGSLLGPCCRAGRREFTLIRATMACFTFALMRLQRS